MKATLIGMGNEGRRYYFIFKKDKSFFHSFSNFLAQLDLPKLGDYYSIEEEKYMTEEKDLPFSTEGIDLDKEYEEIKDKVVHRNNEKYDIDIFYGQEKAIVVVRLKRNDKGELKERIKSISNFEEFE